jgi:phage shock protein PspC (stress-responsive transcriptional regulator)/signal transduction histidine kinase
MEAMSEPRPSPTWRASIPPRSADDRVIGGVAAGVGQAIGLDPILVRIALIVLAFSGPGLPIYVIAWFVMPEGGIDPAADDRSPVEFRRGVGLILIVLGAVLSLREFGLTPPDEVIWPVLLVGAGVGLVWWQVQPQIEFTRWAAARVGAGIVVMGTGLAAFIAGNISFSAVRDGLFGIAMVVGGLAILIGPWILVLIRDRAEEQRRAQAANARADVAAHLHDSVLQTLALIQRTDDPREMTALARQQERELRRWLYADDHDPEQWTLKSAIDRVAGVVEDRHDVDIEAIVVGDVEMNSHVDALVAAVGEAATNAAKWSGQPTVSVFVEIVDGRVEAFVRDTGVGFDPDDIAEDRLGVRESIVGRMERVGGTVEIVSAPGEGTEVRLAVPVTTGTVPA